MGGGSRVLVALGVACCLTATTMLLLAGHRPWSGPVILDVTARHGLHLLDLPILAAWAAGLAGCAALARKA